MFNFLIGGKIKADAAAIKKLADMVLKKYSALNRKQLAEAILRDFDEDRRYVDSNDISFVFEELADFVFRFVDYLGNKSMFNLVIEGQGKYTGLSLIIDGSNWHCSANDSIEYRATDSAKKLVKVLASNYNIRDLSKLMNRFR